MTNAPAIPTAPPAELSVAAALLATPDGRYLMQLRDDRPGLRLAGHWALFGGAVEPGETAEAALRRELREELELEAGPAERLATTVWELPRDAARTLRIAFFVVPIAAADVDGLVQHEGAGMRLFTAAELAREARVAPWDLAAVLLHARRATLFPRGSGIARTAGQPLA